MSGLDELAPLLPHIDYFLPNNDEAHQLTGEADVGRQGRALVDAGANTVIITLGEAGAVAVRRDQQWRCGIYESTAVDPTGSGDAFAAGVVAGILRGCDVPDQMRYGAALGASATRRVGTTDGVFTKSETDGFLESRSMEVTCGSVKS